MHVCRVVTFLRWSPITLESSLTTGALILASRSYALINLLRMFTVASRGPMSMDDVSWCSGRVGWLPSTRCPLACALQHCMLELAGNAHKPHPWGAVHALARRPIPL